MAFHPSDPDEQEQQRESPGSGHSSYPRPWILLEAVELLGIWLHSPRRGSNKGGPGRKAQPRAPRYQQGPLSTQEKLKDAWGIRGLILA